MSNVRRGWVAGATVVLFAAGLAAAASPHRAPADLAPMRDARHAGVPAMGVIASARPAPEPSAAAPVPAAERPAPSPIARIGGPAPARRAEPKPSSSVTAVLGDPSPDPLPMTLDDLFPARPAASGASASTGQCFDQIQGVGGISQCSETTVRALK